MRFIKREILGVRVQRGTDERQASASKKRGGMDFYLTLFSSNVCHAHYRDKTHFLISMFLLDYIFNLGFHFFVSLNVLASASSYK